MRPRSNPTNAMLNSVGLPESPRCSLWTCPVCKLFVMRCACAWRDGPARGRKSRSCVTPVALSAAGRAGVRLSRTERACRPALGGPLLPVTMRGSRARSRGGRVSGRVTPRGAGSMTVGGADPPTPARRRHKNSSPTRRQPARFHRRRRGNRARLL